MRPRSNTSPSRAARRSQQSPVARATTCTMAPAAKPTRRSTRSWRISTNERSFPRQELGGEGRPLVLHRAGGDRLAGAAVPAAGIAHVAFLVMQMGMHPIDVVVVLVLLADLVRLVPVALGRPPQRLQRRDDGRRLGGQHAPAELLDL